MNIVSKENLIRNYQHLTRHNPPTQALQHLAERFGLPAEVVAEAVGDVAAAQ